MVSCPNVKQQCFNVFDTEDRACPHAVPHDRGRMCTWGGCPVTFRRLECSEHPVQVKVHEHLREEGSLKNLDVHGLVEFWKSKRDQETFKKEEVKHGI